MLSVLFLGPTSPYPRALLLAQEDASNPVNWLASLGPFAAAAAVGWVYTRDLRQRLDVCQTQLNDRIAGDAAIRDTLVGSVRTIEANTAAMSATRDALAAHREVLRDISLRLRALERRR